MDNLMQWGNEFIIALQRWSGLSGPMQFFSFFGNEEFFVLFMPVLYWCIDAGLGARVASLLILSNSSSELLKLVFHMPRPFWIDTRVKALGTEINYALPSGHTLNSTVILGFLAAQTKKWQWWAAALVFILCISFSRVYLGMHFPTDVLGGWLAGGLVLGAFLYLERPVTAWLKRLGLWQQMGLALAVSLIYLALTGGTLAAIASTPDPVVWDQNAAVAGQTAAEARNTEGSVTMGGMLFGLGAALALSARGARFDVTGPWWKRGARLVVGAIGIAILWLGLKYIFPIDPAPAALVFRYIRYALTMLWALYLAPQVFVKLKLAGS